MNTARLLGLLVAANLAAFSLLPHVAQADDYNFAFVRCNATTGVIDIQESFTEDDMNFRNAPAGYQIKSLGELVDYVSPPKGVPDDATHGTYRRKIGEWQLSCELKGVVYRVVLSPWSEEDMVMAPCGPGDPDLELTVFREERMLVRNLRFAGGCLHHNATFVAAELSEARQTVTLEQVTVPPSDKPGPNIDIPYAKMPMFDQTKSAIFSPKRRP